MKYAITDENDILQAVMSVPGDQEFSWEGPTEFKVRASDDFDIDPDRDFADYKWDGEKFVLRPERLQDGLEQQVQTQPQSDISAMIEEVVNVKLEELGLV